MITITSGNYTPYNKIPQPTNPASIPNVVIYPGIFSGPITKKLKDYLEPIKETIRSYDTKGGTELESLLVGIQQLTGLTFDSYVINGPPHFGKGDSATIIFQPYTINFKRKNAPISVKYRCPAGTVILLRKSFFPFWYFNPPKHLVITFFNANVLPLRDLYLQPWSRNRFLKVIQDKLGDLHQAPYGQQCVSKYIKSTNLLGAGDYGNVFMATVDGMEIALKLAKLKPEAIDTPYSRYNSSWYEVIIMKDILRPIVESRICPNLPLLFDSFVCNDCELTIRNKTEKHPCVILITELAGGSLRDYLRNHNPSDEELYSALFQVMAGLHAIQLYGQIMNFDVKADNILFYNITPGGYWVYTIHGKKFYVPNLGFLFVLSDFGISRTMSPEFQLYRDSKTTTFRLGSRFAMIINKKFSPIQAPIQPDYKGDSEPSSKITWLGRNVGKRESMGAQYRLNRDTQKIYDCNTVLTDEQKEYLKRKNIPSDPQNKNFFLFPEIIPPFEYYNDTQDAIRMFIGGKRTTQRGDHRRYPVIKEAMYKLLKKYNGKGDSMSDLKFSKQPEQVLAGYFISTFFVKNHNYTKKQDEKDIIYSYEMS